MSYVKNYNPGKITVDLPTANYIHELPLLSFGDIYGNFSLSMVFNRQMKADNSNPYHIAAGFKLNLQKKLFMENGKPVQIQDANGNCVDIIGSNSPFALDDDSQRIIRLSEGYYTLENADMSKEQYDQNGRITCVYNKYNDLVLTYTYNAAGKMTAIVYRNSKRINLYYNGSNKLSEIVYQNAGCSTSVSYISNGINVSHYSGVTYNLTYDDTTFTAQATAVENGTTTTHASALSGSAANAMTIVEQINGETVNSTTYEYPENIANFTKKYTQVEITDHLGVKVRAYFKENQLLYSHEIGAGDVEFVDNKYPGIIEIKGVCNDVVNNYVGRTQRFDSGNSLLLEENENALHWRIGGEVINITKKGYRCILSGWIKLINSNSQEEIPLEIEKDGSTYHGTIYIPKPAAVGQWSYFVAGFAHEFDLLHITISKGFGDIDAKDFRLDFQPTAAASDNSGAEVSYVDDVLICHTGESDVYIPIVSAKFSCGTLDISESGRVYYDDLLKYKINQRKNENKNELYCNHARNVLITSTGASVDVIYDGTSYKLNDCYLGKQQFSKNGTVITRIRDDDCHAFLVSETMDSTGNIISTQMLDDKLDVISSTTDGITKTYIRDHGLLTSEGVTGLYSRTVAYSADDAGNPTVTATDEFGKNTVYTMDPVWGVVTSVSLPDGTVVTDTYDDDMCVLNNRTFGSTSGRSNAFTYSRGNLSRVQADNLYFNFGYSKDKLTGVQKNGTQIETHVHYTNRTDSYYPHGGSPLNTVQTYFDKYNRMTSVTGVLENKYYLWTNSETENDTNTWNTNVCNGSAQLAVSTDKMRNETSRYVYDGQGRLAGKTVTDNTSPANTISSETFSYDKRNRLNAHTVIYDPVNGKSVGSSVTYHKDEADPTADDAVKTYGYKLSGVSRCITSNLLDDFRRLREKKTYFDANTFRKSFFYGHTRVGEVMHEYNDTFLGRNTYTYDDCGRIKSEIHYSAYEPAHYKLYEYDQYGQLIGEENERLAKNYFYSYNNNGNLTSVVTYDAEDQTYTEQTYTYHATYPDRLINFNGKAIGYDALGRPTSYDGKTYTWSKDKLARIWCGNSSQGGSLYEDCSFTYNAYGQRVQKRYAYDPNPASNSDYSYSYETTYQYDHFGRLIREVCTERYIGGHVNNREFLFLYDESGVVGVMYKLNNSSFVRYYYQRNLQGDVVALYDENGTRKVEYAYDAWGNCTITYGAGTDLAKSNPIRYRGYYYDRETGLYYLNARYYNPQWRRFISPDDTADINPETVNGLNRYCYCNNNPVTTAYVTLEGNEATNNGAAYSPKTAYRAIGNTDQFNLSALPWLIDHSTTIYGTYSAISAGVPIFAHYIKYAKTINNEFHLYGISKWKTSLQLANVNLKITGLDAFLLGINVGLDIYDSVQRGVSPGGIILGAGLTAVSGIGMLYLNKGIMWGCTTIGTAICPGLGTGIGFAVGLVASVAVDIWLGNVLSKWIDSIAT